MEDEDMVNYCDPSAIGSHLRISVSSQEELIKEEIDLTSIGEDIDFVLSH
jgi:hypothetical protein